MARTKIAVYPGSFDPITNGHIDLVERTLRVFNRVIVAIASNPNKDDSLFSVNERLEMIQQVFRAQGKRVQADSFEGLLVDYAEKVGAGVIIRGLRAVSDFEYEFQMAMMNRELRPKLETLFMMTGESYFYISSRLVKEVVSLGGDVSALVPKSVLKKLREKFKG
ncbi:MAG: pantetheine-phosphate adenylyltransferase [Deltaproteobacteria bacterium RIFCSPLOWO2_02_56_12]|jgi:pantetheine-phosphate adenylyltransferase|nr:MAG: pantetheine-phosphate adenylyltransferase [Deltaproteobacteria bacterium RIFCSPLOWO2_02_56_12]